MRIEARFTTSDVEQVVVPKDLDCVGLGVVVASRVVRCGGTGITRYSQDASVVGPVQECAEPYCEQVVTRGEVIATLYRNQAFPASPTASTASISDRVTARPIQPLAYRQQAEHTSMEVMAMGFNGLQPADGPFFLAPGAAIRVHMWYGDPGNDHGAQWIMAHPLAGEAPTELVVSDHSKILDYAIGCIEVNGPARPCPGEDPFYRYGVTVTNWGDSGVRFNIQGGGNT